jgi:hypothetical protein
MTTSGSAAAVLTEVGGWGPFFTLETHAPEAIPEPPWRPLTELIAGSSALAERVAGVRAHLTAGGGEISDRVAASVTHLGLAARLISPTFGAKIHSGQSLSLTDAWWQPELGGAFPLSVTGDLTGSPTELLDNLGHLVEAAAGFSLSDKVLWGNVASAVNGAVTMITQARPDLADRARAEAEDLLALRPLRTTWMRRPDGRFQRRSCCLIYRASPTPSRQAVCGDCVLAKS